MKCCTGVGELKNISLRMAFCTLDQMFMSVARGILESRHLTPLERRLPVVRSGGVGGVP